MIGSAAFVVWFMLCLFPVLIVAGIWGKGRKRIGPLTVMGTILAVFVFVMASYTFGRTLFNLRALHSLKSDDVQSLTVNGIEVSDAGRKRAIIEAVSRSVLFFPQHGGWLKEFFLHIAFKSGAGYDLRIAEYPSLGGVVVVWPRYAFSESLSGALREADIDINAPK